MISREPSSHSEGRQGRIVCLVTFIINVLLSVAKLFFGFLTMSSALIADGFHSLSDTLSDVLVFVAFIISRKPHDADHPYGHGKIETFLSSILGMSLIVVGFYIARDGISRIAANSSHAISGIAIPVAAISLIVKELLYHYNIVMSRKVRSQALYANAWHHRSDAISSLAVLFGVTGARYGFPIFDPIAACVVAVIIAIVGVIILIKTGKELIETSVDDKTIAKLKGIADGHDLVISSHRVFARNVGNNMVVEMHIVVASETTVEQAHDIANGVEHRIRELFPHAHNVLVHVDPYNDEDEDAIKESL